MKDFTQSKEDDLPLESEANSLNGPGFKNRLGSGKVFTDETAPDRGPEAPWTAEDQAAVDAYKAPEWPAGLTPLNRTAEQSAPEQQAPVKTQPTAARKGNELDAQYPHLGIGQAVTDDKDASPFAQLLAKHNIGQAIQEQGPTTAEAIGWAVGTDGMGSNLWRWAKEATAWEDPKAEQEITASLPALLKDLPEEYGVDLLDSPTLAIAQQKADLLRLRLERRRRSDRDGWGAQMFNAVGGFLFDPTNLIPGGILFKGVSKANAAIKMYTMAGKAAATASVASRLGLSMSAGAVEELIRNYPRLQTDGSYGLQQYTDEAKFGALFGAAFPLPGMAKTGVSAVSKRMSKRTRSSFEKTTDALRESVAVQSRWEAAASFAKATWNDGLIKVVMKADGTTGWRKAHETATAKTKSYVNGKYRKAEAFRANVADAVAKGDTTAAATSVRSVINDISSAFKKAGIPEDKLTAAVEAAGKASDDLKVQAESAAKGAETATETIRKERAVMSKMDRVADAIEALLTVGDDFFGVPTLGIKGAESDIAAREARRMVGELRNRAQAYHSAARDAVDQISKRRGYDPIDRALTRDEYLAAAKDWSERGMKNSLHERHVLQVKIDSMLGRGAGKEVFRGLQGNFRKGIVKALKVAIPDMKTEGKTLNELIHAIVKSDRIDIIQKDAILFRTANNVKLATDDAVLALRDRVLMVGPQRGRDLDQVLQAVETLGTDMSSILDHQRVLLNNQFDSVAAVGGAWAEISLTMANDAAELRKQFKDAGKLQKALSKQYGNFSQSLTTKLMETEVPLAQWFSMNVLESPTGFGGRLQRGVQGSTVAVDAVRREQKALEPVFNAYKTLIDEVAEVEGWSKLKRFINFHGDPAQFKDVDRINREVMAEINDRFLGRNSTRAPHIKKYANVLSDSYGDLHTQQLQAKVAGITRHNKIEHYQHQMWTDGKIMELWRNNTRSDVEELFTKGYMGAGLDEAQARAMSKAMLDQKMASLTGAPVPPTRIGAGAERGTMPEMDVIIKNLRRSASMSDADIDKLVDKMGLDVNPGYTKRRMQIDITATHRMNNGTEVSIMDVMNTDTASNYARYAKEATARSSLSQLTGGVLNSNQAMTEMIQAIAIQGQEMGVLVNTADIRNSLQMLMGLAYDGQLPVSARRVRDAVSLSGMGGLGESQLAELGLALNRGMRATTEGIANTFFSRYARRNPGVAEGSKSATHRKLAVEIQELSGLFEDMALINRNNVHLDEAGAELTTSALSKFTNTLTGGKYRNHMKYAQTRYTGYAAVRTWEEQIAMASILHDAIKFRSGEAWTSGKRLRDIGFSTANVETLERLVKEHGELNANGTIKSLGSSSWPATDQQMIGNLLQRHASQAIQKTFVGELSPAMMNPWWAFAMQFKQYPMAAVEKQQRRSLKLIGGAGDSEANKEIAMGIMLNNATSGLARVARYQSLVAALPSDEREARMEQLMSGLGRDTFAYTGMAGMFPELGNLAGTFGVDNAFAGHTRYNDKGIVGAQLPALNWANKWAQVAQPNNGELDSSDVRNLQTAAPLGTIGAMNILFGILQNSIDEDEE